MLRSATILLAICATLAFWVGWRFEDNSAAEKAVPIVVSPKIKTANLQQELLISRSVDGHFFVSGQVDGVELTFLIDTGASNVILTPADARRLDMRLGPEKFTQIYQTANGEVRAAPVTLRQIAIGPIRIDDVSASVNGADMEYSLLGQSFLRRLKKVEIRGDLMAMSR